MQNEAFYIQPSYFPSSNAVEKALGMQESEYNTHKAFWPIYDKISFIQPRDNNQVRGLGKMLDGEHLIHLNCRPQTDSKILRRGNETGKCNKLINY